eukprot:3533981-Prymnesium_polylepis.1
MVHRPSQAQIAHTRGHTTCRSGRAPTLERVGRCGRALSFAPKACCRARCPEAVMPRAVGPFGLFGCACCCSGRPAGCFCSCPRRHTSGDDS